MELRGTFLPAQMSIFFLNGYNNRVISDEGASPKRTPIAHQSFKHSVS